MKTIPIVAIAFSTVLSVLSARAVTQQVEPGYGTTINWKNVDPPLSTCFSNEWRIGLSTGGWWRGPYVMTAKGTTWTYEEKGGMSIKYSENKSDPTRNKLKIKCETGIPFGVRVSLDFTKYCIVDVSGGPDATNYPISYQDTAPTLDDTHKTTKIVLCKIPPGSFTMGSPTNDPGRYSDETQHKVTLTKAFYIGIYEITQTQYSNVMGVNASYFTQGAHAPKRPVERVSWNMARGGTWPGGSPSNETFIGKLRSRTGLAFDLPTEAQWEYACRAGTTKALNSNTDLTSTSQDANMDILGRYWYNGGSTYDTDPVNGAHSAVGSYLVNQWGLYDMHGNVWEWCLDWYQSDLGTGDVTDPSGAGTGTFRVICGGSWGNSTASCRSARRVGDQSNTKHYQYGFRLSLTADH